MDALIQWFEALEPWGKAGVSLAAALVAYFILTRVITIFTRSSETHLDDQIIAAVSTPIVASLVLVAIGYLLKAYVLEAPAPVDEDGTPPRLAWQLRILLTIGILFWMRGLMRASDAVLDAMARRVDDFQWIQPRSLPLFEILAKLGVVGGAIYAIMLTWRIDVTAWLASAGILGLAIGFAAKDTLANLFAGIFILTDAPYKLGDFIVTEAGERGQVTDIGIRSTRILTRDDIQITIPNAVMANSKIVNESSGRHIKRRIRCAVGIAYGADVEAAERVLLDAAKSVEYLVSDPAPRVRFRRFGDSALELELMGWIDEPVLRGRALHQLNIAVYKGLEAAGIGIPFPQRDVHLHQA
ncbi:MAG: mechanosensitive ion channel family protein [Planctomycetota bacterium]|nr:mechanosensitive ion channel family protein [Planctomycetota bacterium]